MRLFAQLRMPLCGLLATILTAAAIVTGAMRELAKAEAEHDAATRERNRQEGLLNEIRREAREFDERARSLKQLQASGILGDRPHPDPAATLRAAQRALRLPALQHDPTRQRVALETPGSGLPAWFATPIRIRLQLLHEEDLLRFLARIEREAHALIAVRQCRLAQEPADTHLVAECRLEWLRIEAEGERG